MKLDLSKFQKTAEEKNHTTLVHENGHELKIAHKGLTDKLKKELAGLPIKMAKGGPVKGPFAHTQTIYKQIPGHGVGPEPASLSGMSPPSKAKPETDYTEPQDQGGNDVVLNNLNRVSAPFSMAGEEQAHYPPCINPSCKSYGRSHPNCRCYSLGGEQGHFAEGGEVGSYCSENRAHKKDCEYFADGGGVTPFGTAADWLSSKKDAAVDWVKGQKPENMDEFVQATNPGTDPAQQQAMASGTPSPMQSAPVDNDQMSYADQAAPSAQNATLAPEQPQQVPEASGAEPAPMEEPTPLATTEVNAPAPQEIQKTPIEHFQERKQQNQNDIGQHYQMFIDDIDAGHIKPKTVNQLFANESTPGKIGTLFSLMLGGIGAGLTGKDNPVLSMMNSQIENDLKAQQESAKNKQNLLKINQEGLLAQANSGVLTQDMKQKAWALTRMQMNYAAYHNLVQQTQKLPMGSPQRQQAEQTLALMNNTIQNENFGIADRAASASALGSMLGGSGGIGSGGGQNTMLLKSGLLGPEAAKVGGDIEDKSIPGIPGKAARPIQQADRDKVVAMKTLSDKAQDVLEFAKAHKGSLTPKVRAQGEQKAAELVNFYNNSLGGALTGYKLPWLEQQIGKNPTSIFQDILGSNARLQEIKNSNDTRMGTLLQSYGLKGGSSGKAHSQSSAPQETMSKSGRPMIQKNGKWVYK